MKRWIFLEELIPLVIILLVLDSLVFTRKLLAFQPSPLWLPILLIAPRRGSIAGVVCGLVAAALNLWFLHEQGILWQDLLHKQTAVLLESGLFIFFGAFLGAVGERQTRRMEFFRNKADTLSKQLDSDQIKRIELERKCVEMEKRIAGQGATILTLHDNFKRLDNASSEEDLFFTLDYILRNESKAENCCVWRLGEGASRLIAGNCAGDPPPIAMAAGRNQMVISSADWSRHHKTLPGADLAALVMDNESERFVATLAGCPFVRLTREFSLRIGLLAEQAGLVLGALRDREKLRRQATLDKESGMVSEGYLRRRVNEAIALAGQYRTQLALVACSIIGSSDKYQARLETVLASSIRACTLFSDGVAWFADAKAFVIVLPRRDRQGAATIMHQIESNLKLLNLRDEHNQDIYKIVWGIYVCDGSLKGEAAFERLFSDMAGDSSS